MLKITFENRSYRIIEDENGVCFIHHKTLRSWDQNLYNYNALSCCNGPFCKGAFQFLQDEDFHCFIYYKDGSTYTEENGEVKSIRISQIENAVVNGPCGDEFYGDLWKITYDAEYQVYFLRERDEYYDGEVDAYIDGKIVPVE